MSRALVCGIASGFCVTAAARQPGWLPKPLWSRGAFPPLSACLSVPLIFFIQWDFAKLYKTFTFRTKNEAWEADAIKRTAQLCFPSRQPSPKITGTWSIHLPAERAPLRAGSHGLWNHKRLGFLGQDHAARFGAGQALARPMHGAGHSSRA